MARSRQGKENFVYIMMGEAVSFVTEYVAKLGLVVGKEHITDKIDENKLKSALQAYIGRQQKLMKSVL